LQREWNFSPQKRAVLTAFSMVGAIAGGVIFGLLSDRWGRRRAMVLAFGLAILVIPLWAFAPSLVLLFAGAFLMQFMVQGAWGVIPAHITELSPDSVRGFCRALRISAAFCLRGLSRTSKLCLRRGRVTRSLWRWWRWWFSPQRRLSHGRDASDAVSCLVKVKQAGNVRISNEES
jgi:MFS family permease